MNIREQDAFRKRYKRNAAVGNPWFLWINDRQVDINVAKRLVRIHLAKRRAIA